MERTREFYENALGLHAVKMTENYDDPGTLHDYFSPTPEGEPGTVISYFEYSGSEGRPGGGANHHFALGVEDEDALREWRDHLQSRGVRVSPIRDRTYFESIYLSDPDGLTIEFATSGPGFEASDSAKNLVREAGELAAGVDANLVLLHVTTTEEYENTRNSLERISSLETSHTAGQVLERARQFVADIGREVLDGIDVEYESVGRIGDERDEILDVAHEYGCDHVFLAGRKRSPTGKALFGNRTQSVILDFDGAITVVTE